MRVLRNFPGYVLAFTLAAIGCAMVVMAWAGWVVGVNWYWALGALLLSAFARFNAFTVVGSYFFASDYLNWDMIQSLAFASIGLMFLTPAIVRDISLMFTGQDITGRT